MPHGARTDEMIGSVDLGLPGPVVALVSVGAVGLASAPLVAITTIVGPTYDLVLPLLLVWAAALVPFAWSWRVARRLERVGVRHVAAVIEVEFEDAVSRRPGWSVRYRYRVGGRELAAARRFEGTSRPCEPGAPVAILYDPSRPRRHGWLERRDPAFAGGRRTLAVEDAIAALFVVFTGVASLTMTRKAALDPSLSGPTSWGIAAGLAVGALAFAFGLEGDPRRARRLRAIGVVLLAQALLAGLVFMAAPHP
jgi:hypothetical protein